jgi:signal transduction histidine kinase
MSINHMFANPVTKPVTSILKIDGFWYFEFIFKTKNFISLINQAIAMKNFTSFLLVIILTGMIFSCTRKSSGPGLSINTDNKAILSDSLNILDSLVNTFKASDHPLAIIYSKRALSLALTINTEESFAKAFLLIGVAHRNFNNDSSFIYFIKALNIADKSDLEEIKPKIYYNLAMVYYSASDTKSAILYLDSSITISEKIRNYVWLSNAYNVMGNLKYDLLDTLDAKSFFDSSYNIAKRHSLHRQMGIAMASLSRFERDPALSSAMRKKAIESLSKQHGNEEEIALILINLGSQSSIADTSIKYYQSAIRIAKSANSAEVEIGAYNNLAYSFMDKRDYFRAESCLVDYAIPLAERNKNYDWLSSLYDSYCDVLMAQNKTEKALLYEQKALKTRKVADKKQATAQMRLLSELLNVKKRELKIQTNEKELQQKENNIQHLHYWFSISFTVFLILLFYILWKQQKNKIKYQNELIISAKRLIESEENMKGNVSMELHDLTTPFYFTMLQQIEEAQIADANIENELKNKLSTMHERIRQISHRMNNSFLQQLTLAEQVKGLCEDLKSISGVPIHCNIRQEDFHLLPEEIIHIYRIIQELLTNGIKYVTFGEIAFSLSEQGGYFFVIYEDTGPGFDMDMEKNKGLGVTNIIERAKIIGGKAVLKTAPGKGTKWNISIPLKPKQK